MSWRAHGDSLCPPASPSWLAGGSRRAPYSQTTSRRGLSTARGGAECAFRRWTRLVPMTRRRGPPGRRRRVALSHPPVWGRKRGRRTRSAPDGERSTRPPAQAAARVPGSTPRLPSRRPVAASALCRPRGLARTSSSWACIPCPWLPSPCSGSSRRCCSGPPTALQPGSEAAARSARPVGRQQ